MEKKELIKLIESRSRVYSLAKFKVCCDNMPKNEIVNKILEIYEKSKNKN